MTAYTGTLPTLPAGKIPPATDWLELLNALHALADPLSTWTPTLTNLTAGSGTVGARYRQVGKWVDFRFEFTLGAGSAVGTQPGFTLPVAPHSSYSVGSAFASACLVKVGGFAYPAGILYDGSSVMGFRVIGAAGAYAVHDGNVTATAPFTFATPDRLVAWGAYEAA